MFAEPWIGAIDAVATGSTICGDYISGADRSTRSETQHLSRLRLA